jgi:hypothetical protein
MMASSNRLQNVAHSTASSGLVYQSRPKWHRVGNQIDATFVTARAYFVNTCGPVIAMTRGQIGGRSQAIYTFSATRTSEGTP